MAGKLRIRLALAHEGQALARIGAAAFIDDPFDSYMYPKRKQNLKYYQRLYQQKLDSQINHSLCWVMVAEVVTEAHDKHGNIKYEDATPAAYAIWTRESAKEDKKIQRRLRALGLRDPTFGLSLAQRFKKRVVNCGLVEAIRDRSNPVVDRKRFSAFWEGFGDMDDDSDSEPEREEYWHLQELAVAPEFRRRGVGGALLEWGKEWARKEDVPILLESTPMGRSLYQAAGFSQCSLWRWGDKPDMTWYMMLWQPST
ncbi:hypothetical protein Daus18300_000035 [Diaporthe australafricana]|uniref:N-acetyltransferase domain-containing protein n=1 Tax=Diaporthe australafricana TaxID=127596 RepID=A0ABR3Y7W1_9PEZI